MNKKKFLALAVATAIAETTMLGVTSATSDYMHYQDGTISICDPSSNGTKCITMQDKNLGATQAGVGCINYANYCYAGVQNYSDMDECLADDMSQLGCMGWEYFGDLFHDEEDCNDRGQSLFEACMAEQGTGMYGKHFQWGNNHGFLPGENGSNNFPGGESTSYRQINCSANSPSNPVNSSVFIVGYFDYCTTSTRNDNLRGGENDSAENNYGFDETNNVATNVGNRRGPCEDGYHVPSIGEWNQVLEYWAEENGIELEDDGGLKYNNTPLDGLKFQEDFKIPFAGVRDYDEARVFGMRDHADLWSSSPRVGSDYARYFYLDLVGAYANNDNGFRSYAFSVRCFKDSYLEFPSSGGGGNTGQVTLTLTAGENTCTLQDYNLGTHNVSSDDQNVSTSGQNIVCEFLKNTSATIQLSMGDLVDGTKNISRQNFIGVVTSLGNPLGTIANLTGGSYNFLSSHIIYTKQANTIGTWTGSLAIEGTIPAGTPGGQYTGELNVIICEGC